MLAKTFSFGLCGLEAYPVTIEADISPGLPAITVVGLPDNAVKESRERVRAAIKNSGLDFPASRITINLAPANTKKEGPAFDLAIALSLLAAGGQIPLEPLNHYAFLGELSLDGRIQPVNGALSIALAANPQQCEGLIVPYDNAKEAALANQAPIYPAKYLNDVVQFLTNPQHLSPLKADITHILKHPRRFGMDFSDVKGQAHLKRGLEVAAAGGHNVLMIGPPGSGKTMLAKRLAAILPDMTLAEALQTTQIHSIAGLLRRQTGIVAHRPFRAPHHTASDIALVGGGVGPKPGEVTLAHNGILFLDEFPEFSRHVLEVLRQPLEDGYVTVARARNSLQFPAQFMLVAAMNPCPCGWHGVPNKICRCSALEIERYQQKISGPLLDRIDIHLHALPLKTAELLATSAAECSTDIKGRTMQARERQWQRFKDTPAFCNARMNPSQIRDYCVLSEEAKGIFAQAMDQLQFSARAHDKILKVSRTISDLEGGGDILPRHIAEAISYRSLDRLS